MYKNSSYKFLYVNWLLSFRPISRDNIEKSVIYIIIQSANYQKRERERKKVFIYKEFIISWLFC